jgi:hypothetical protein
MNIMEHLKFKNKKLLFFKKVITLHIQYNVTLDSFNTRINALNGIKIIILVLMHLKTMFFYVLIVFCTQKSLGRN